jgi:arsenate reductase
MSILNVLFLCTHNSARSIMAEALLRHMAEGRVNVFSAGSHPRGEVHPLALEVLEKRGISTAGLHSKAWDDFATPQAPRMSVVITVCDGAAGEMCPIWPGAPIKSHWGVEEPGRLAEGRTDEMARQAFGSVLEKLERRIQCFLELSLEEMEDASIKQALDLIGQMN